MPARHIEELFWKLYSVLQHVCPSQADQAITEMFIK